MKRRGPALATVVIVAGLAGCAAFPFVGPACGPGGTDIGAIDENATGVALKGEVTHLNSSVLVIDDGTGQAAIALYDAGVADQVEAGDCVIAERAVVVPATERPEDVLVVDGALYTEEFAPEDE